MVKIVLGSYEIYLMSILCLVGILGTWKAGRQYQKLIRQTENMMGTGHPFLLQIKSRFENTYRVNTGINNIKAFVWKNVDECKYMGMKLNNLGHAAGRMGVLCVVLGMFFSIWQYWYANENVKSSIFFAIFGIFLGLLDFFVLYRTNMDVMEEKLVFHLQDYLENTMVNRLKNAKEDERYLARTENARRERASRHERQEDIQTSYQNKEQGDSDVNTYQDEYNYLRESFQTIASDREDMSAEGKHKMTKKEEQLIDDILKDYFH
jgi:hypothetical protein